MATENTGNLSEESSNSSSRCLSPLDNLTADPSFKCAITDIELTSRSTRQRSTSEGLGLDSSSLYTTPIFKTSAVLLTDEAEQVASTADESQTQSPNIDPLAPSSSKPREELKAS